MRAGSSQTPSRRETESQRGRGAATKRQETLESLGSREPTDAHLLLHLRPAHVVHRPCGSATLRGAHFVPGPRLLQGDPSSPHIPCNSRHLCTDPYLLRSNPAPPATPARRPQEASSGKGAPGSPSARLSEPPSQPWNRLPPGSAGGPAGRLH